MTTSRAIGEKLQTEVKGALTGNHVLSQEACWRIPDAPYASSKRPFDLIGARYGSPFAIECKRTEKDRMSTSVLKGHQRLELARFQLAVARNGAAAVAVDVAGWKALIPIWQWMRLEEQNKTLGEHLMGMSDYEITEYHNWSLALSCIQYEAFEPGKNIPGIVRAHLEHGR